MMNYSSTYVLFVSTLLLTGSSPSVNAFGIAPPTLLSVQRLASTSLSYSEHTADKTSTRNIAVEPGFEERMRAAVQKKRSMAASSSTIKKKKKTAGRPDHVLEATNMKEFNELVTAEKDQVVVVRFYAPWCRACKSITPSYFKFSGELEDTSSDKVKFVDCPMTAVSTEVHKTLGIKTIPFAHVYHPETGLAEERSLSRRNYSTFENVVKSYVNGVCDLISNAVVNTDEEDEDVTSYASNPWTVQKKSKGIPFKAPVPAPA